MLYIDASGRQRSLASVIADLMDACLKRAQETSNVDGGAHWIALAREFLR